MATGAHWQAVATQYVPVMNIEHSVGLNIKVTASTFNGQLYEL